MSAQSAKKKRIGSRRRGANQNKTSEADELHIMDNTSVAQLCVPEENTESTNVFANPDSSQSEIQNTPSPELTENRRKLGTSRRNKRGQHAKDLTESYGIPREEVEEETRGNESPKTTRMTLATERQRQEELSQWKEHDVCVTHDSSLHLVTTTDDSSEVQKSTITNLQTDQSENETGNKMVSESCKPVETVLRGIHESDNLQRDDVKENAALVGTSELTTLNESSCPKFLNLMEMPEEPLNVYSVTEKESKERDKDTELLSQDGNVSSSCVVNESHVESVVTQFSSTPEITTDESSPIEKTELEHSVEQAAFSSPKEELPKDEEQNEHEMEDQVEDDVKPSREQTVHQEKEELISEMEGSDSLLQSLQSEIHAPLDSQPQQNDTNFTPIGHRRKLGSSRRSKGRQHDKDSVAESDQEPRMEVVGNARDHEPLETTQMSLTTEIAVQEKPMETMLEEMHSFDTVKTEDVNDHIKENELVGITEHGTISLQPNSTVDQQLTDQSNIMEMPEEELLSMYCATEKESKERDEDTELSRQDGNLQDTNLVCESYLKSEDTEAFITQEVSTEKDCPREDTEPECNVEQEIVPSPEDKLSANEEQKDMFDLSEVKDARYSEDAVDNIHKQEVNPTHEIDWSSESVIQDATEKSQMISGNPRDQAEVSDTYQSELIVKTTDDFVIKQEDSNSDDKQDEHPTRERSFETVERSYEDYRVYDTDKLQIGDIERVDTALAQLHEIEDQVEDDIKPSREQTVHQEEEELIPEMEGSDSSLQSLQSEIHAPLDSQPQQNDTNFTPIGHRRKLGSSRRSKGRQHAKNYAAESDQEPTEEVDGNARDHEPLETTQMSLTTETAVQKNPMETMLEEMHSFDTVKTEDVNDHIKENELVGITEHGTISLQPSSTVDQQLTDQSNIMEMPEEELLSVYCATEKESKERDEDTELSRQDGNLQDTNLVCESYLKSEDTEAFITQEVSTEKDCPREDTEPECNVEQEIVPSPEDKLSANEEQKDMFDLSEVKDARHSEDAVDNIHKQEVNPTHEIDRASESVIQDATEKSDMISGNPRDQAEVSDAYQSELIVKTTDDSVIKQEDSNSDDKQDEHPTRERSFETVERSCEDYCVYDTDKLQIGDIERVDTALAQLHEIEDQVEDDIKPSHEQTVHQEEEEFISEMEGSDSSLQSLQSEIHAPLDSQPQQNDTKFTPIGHRRKLGSSRRSKGRQHAKNYAAESDQEPTEEVVGNARDHEPLETTQMSLITETAVQENPMETMLEEMHSFDTVKTEDVNDHIKENELVGIAEHSSISLQPNSTVDQQLTDQSNIMEMPEEELLSVYCATEKESKERDEDTELSRQEVNLQDTNLVCESYLKSEDTEAFITQEVSTEKDCPREDTEPECSVKQEIGPSPEDELSTTEEQKDIFDLSEVEDARHSKDAVDNIHEQEINPTYEVDHSSESLIQDATEKYEMISGNLNDQAEVSDTYQAELIVKTTYDSAIKEENSNSDDKQDEHPTKGKSLEAARCINEDYHVYDTDKLQIGDIERVDTALAQLHEIEDQVEDDIKPSHEQTIHQEEEELISEMEGSDSSLQSLQSEIHAPLDSQPQQNNTNFIPIGHRRKLGSSRRSKGRQHAKNSAAESYQEPTEEVVGNARDHEPLETTQMSLTTETAVQERPMETKLEEINTLDTVKTEDVNDHIKENELVGITELSLISLQPSSTVDQQLTDQSNIMEMPEEELLSVYCATEKESKERDEDTELLRQDGNLQDTNLVSESHLKSGDTDFYITQEVSTEKDHPREDTEPERSVEQEVVSSPENKLSTTEEQKGIFDLSEVEDAHRSEDAVDNIHKQEINPTHEVDRSSESLIQDATEKSAALSGNLIDQAEVSDTHKVELVVKSTYDSLIKQEDSNSDDKQDEHPTKEKSLEAVEYTNEDCHVYDTDKLQISGIQSVDNALSQLHEIEDQVEDDMKPSSEQTVHQEKEKYTPEMEGRDSSLQSLQSEIHAPLDSQPQQNDTKFTPIGHRRKLGSSRRSKGRQHAKNYAAESDQEPTEEVVGNARDHKPLETTEMSLTTETAVQEKTVETMLEVMGTFDTAKTEEVSDQIKEKAHVDISEHSTTNLQPSSRVDQQLIDQSNSTEMPEELLSVHCATEKESKERDKLFWQDACESQLISEISESSIKQEISTEKDSPREYTELEYSVEQEIVPSPEEELSSNEKQKEHVNSSQVSGSQHSENVVNEVHEDVIKPTQVQEMYHTAFSSVKESDSSLQTLQSEMPAPLDSQPVDNSVTREQTLSGFNAFGSRRKLGSSRRNRQQHVKDPVTETCHKPKEEFVENTRSGEALETANMSLAIETMGQEELKMQTNLDLKPSQKIRTIRSTVTDEEFQEKTTEEDAILSQIVTDNSKMGKDDSIKFKGTDEEEKNVTKEPENSSQPAGYDTVKMGLIPSPEDDSDIQNISCHHDSVTTRSVTLNVLEQEETQKVDAVSCDKDILGREINMQQTDVAIQTVRGVTIKYSDADVESSLGTQGFGQGEVGEDFEDPTKKNCPPQEMNTQQDKVDSSAPFGLEENFRVKLPVDVPENSENMQGKSKQKRRKMASTRRTQFNRKPEEGKNNRDEAKESNTEPDVNIFDKMEVVEEVQMTVTAEVSSNENAKPSLNPVTTEQQETTETSDAYDKGQKLQSITSDLHSIQNKTFDKHELKALLPEQSTPDNEEVGHPAEFVHFTDTTDIERNTNVTQNTQNDEERPESLEAPVVAVADLEIVKSVVREGAGEEHEDGQASIQEPKNLNEGAHGKNPEMKNASPNINSPKRRRKMGSTRRNLTSRSKREDLNQKPEVDNEATEATTNVEVVETETFPVIKEKEELQLKEEVKDSDSDQSKEKVFETVEYSHTGESHFKPLSDQTLEENPVSHGQLVETEHQLTPSDFPAKHDIMSETAGGRRRKLGSSRKLHGHLSNKNQTAKGETHHESNVRSITDDITIKTNEKEPFGLDKISEIDESDKKPLSNTSISKAGGHLRPVSEKTPVPETPVQHPFAENRLGQESQKPFSLAGSSRGAAPGSNSYNVMMVGDSCVGKTSFMKRAHSGKFSLDIPASVGLDSCMWNVVVDGKPVVLQLWDTAGQERFHSITRQIFHKAQAFLLMYDITSSQSFAAVSYWANCIQEGATENVTILLLGNKSDQAKRQVQTQEGETLAKENNFEFMECSAATGENVIQALETVARMLSQKADTREEVTVLHKEPQQKKSSGCC